MRDEYGEFINSDDTYKAIAETLKKDKAVLIGWTDQQMTHFDILFTYQPAADLSQVLNGTMVGGHFLSGSFHGGIKPSYLFVSIMRAGCFGFNIDHDSDYNYYDEKLSGRMKIGEITSEQLADLINGVKKYLRNKCLNIKDMQRSY